MRRILSLTLVAVMLLSTLALTSCDAVTDFFSGLFSREVRTKITETEWQKTFLLENYTITSNVDYNLEMLIDGSAMDFSMSYPGMSIELLVDTEKNLAFYQYDTTWIATQREISTLVGDASLNYWFRDLKYDEFVYEDSTKSYTAKTENYICDLHFADGVLSYAMIMPKNGNSSGCIEIKNIGSTKVELPASYIIANDGKAEPNPADKSVRTEITAAEFAVLENMKNYTFNAIVPTQFATSTIKITENASYQVIEMMGQVMAEQYRVVIDGYYHDLVADADGKYVATQTKEEVEGTVAFLMGADVKFEDLVYDAEGRYYYVTVDSNTNYMYFENGKLVAIANISSDGSEMIALLSDVGTTKIDLPEYTVPDDADNDEVDEYTWNQNMEATNYTISVEAILEGYTYEVYRDGEVVLMEMMKDGTSISMYYVELDGVYYEVISEDGEWIGTAYDGELTLGAAALGGYAPAYSDFEYDSLLEAYVYDDGSARWVAAFRDGKLVNVDLYVIDYEGTRLYISYEISNIGETAPVEAPEFTIVENTEEPEE